MKWLALSLLLSVPTISSAAEPSITGGKRDAALIVAFFPGMGGGHNTVSGHPAQPYGTDLGFVLPKLKAGEKIVLVGEMRQHIVAPPVFKFAKTKGEYLDVLFDKQPVFRFVDRPHDEKDHYLTFKPFHQMFDPKEGKTLLSSGAHPNTKEFLFPHHRGLFFGFNKITYGDKQIADIWHGTDNVFSTAYGVDTKNAGEVFAIHTANVSWHGKDGKHFAIELRKVWVYHVPGGTLLDWSTELSTELESVKLDGDPQHAGFHFRATQEVSKTTAKQTYYLRPDGKGKEGETRNWDAKGKDPKTVDLPWNAMSFVTNEKRYTVLRIPHPDNPKGTRGSERDYGRFGDYFEYTLTPKTPLKLKYRIWLQEGEMTKEQCEAIAEGFVLSK